MMDENHHLIKAINVWQYGYNGKLLTSLVAFERKVNYVLAYELFESPGKDQYAPKNNPTLYSSSIVVL